MEISTCLYRNPQDIENAKHERNVKFPLTMSRQNVIYGCIEYAEIQPRRDETLRLSHRSGDGGRGETCGAATQLDAPGTAQ
jgi:hypothetical protein